VPKTCSDGVAEINQKFGYISNRNALCYLPPTPKYPIFALLGSRVPITRLSWALEYKTYRTTIISKTGVHGLSPEVEGLQRDVKYKGVRSRHETDYNGQKWIHVILHIYIIFIICISSFHLTLI
jgi:hypothetical protein